MNRGEQPMTKSNPVMVAALLSLWAAAIRADDWPQWRGPNRDGVWRETGILESFPPHGLKVRWRAPVGKGWSSPVVADGRVFVTDSELMKPKARERVQCFAETTGKPLWTYSYEVQYPDWAFTPGQEGRPTASPIVQGGKLYTLGKKGDLYCFDASKGEVLWKKNLEQEYQVQEFAFNASPLIEKDLLILCIGSYPATHKSWVLALDKNSGGHVWKTPTEGLTNSSPIAIDAGGKRQVIVWTQGSVTALGPATGKLYWQVPMKTSADSAISTPVFHKNLLFVGGLMLTLDAAKPAASVLWPDTKAFRKALSNTSTSLIQGDYLYSAKSSGELVCLEARTGKQLWETDKVTSLRNGASIHLTPNGSSVLLYTDQGDLIRGRLTGDGYKEISRSRLLKPTYPFGGRKVAWPPPAFANRHVFVRNDEELVCVSLAAMP
jgi:outer membrane protein assembly factor BamB